MKEYKERWASDNDNFTLEYIQFEMMNHLNINISEASRKMVFDLKF